MYWTEEEDLKILIDYIDCYKLINKYQGKVTFLLFAFFSMSQPRVNYYSSCRCLSKCSRTKKFEGSELFPSTSYQKVSKGQSQNFVYFSGFIYTYKEAKIESGRKRDRGLKLLKRYSWREFVSTAVTIYSMVLKGFKETNLFEHYNNSRMSLTLASSFTHSSSS